MTQIVSKWGQSFALRIPEALAEQLHWDTNTEVELRVVDGSLVAQAISDPVYTGLYMLEDLVAGITTENLHGETSTGHAVGKEAW